MTKVIDNFETALFRILKCTVLGIEFGVLFSRKENFKTVQLM